MVINMNSSAGVNTDEVETCSYTCDEPQSYNVDATRPPISQY